MSSSLAKMMTTRALGFSLSLRMILSNSPALGSRGIFTDCEIHRSPVQENQMNGFSILNSFSYSAVSGASSFWVTHDEILLFFFFFSSTGKTILVFEVLNDGSSCKNVQVQYFPAWGMQGIKKSLTGPRGDTWGHCQSSIHVTILPPPLRDYVEFGHKQLFYLSLFISCLPWTPVKIKNL